ncbi:glycerol kinase GlpK [Thalassotalea aquiviva]|uniref:glycerol kinase GlpK n=1 Tax=Thalassotalea aquiviva TaxID=3242415 RepID=UPI00352B9466
MSKYILSIDQGTTSTRAILFSLEGKIHATAQREFNQYFPKNGWVEHDPMEILDSVISTCKDVLQQQNLTASDILGIGITNQRETTVIWDKATGLPVYPAIVWQDRRTADYCKAITSPHLAQLVNDKTGLIIDSYFSATKIKWLLDNVPNCRAKALNNELAFGTIDSFLIWHLTAGKHHKTDATNASRTMLFNIHNQQWDPELLQLFDIPNTILPQVMDCADDFGVTASALFGQAIPIMAVAGDQQAALVGQACFSQGMAKSTYGTGCFLILNTGQKALKSKNRLLTTIAYRLNGETTYAIEGSIFIAGATVQWLRDGLKVIDCAEQTESLIADMPLDHGVFLVPAFTGLGAPYWDPNARGAILGLTRDSGIREIVTAGIQSVCYQTKDLQKAMERDGLRPTELRVDGGMVVNDWMLSFLADILDAKVGRPEIIETTALGVAYLVGYKAGVYQTIDEIANMWRCQYTFTPNLKEEQRQHLYQMWLKAVARVKS